MMNRMIDLFPMLTSLAPEIIEPHTSLDRYGRYFCNGFMGVDGMDYSGSSHVEEMKKRLPPFTLRRTVDEVLGQLPPIVEDVIEVDIGEQDFDIANTQIATLARLVGIAKLPAMKQYIHDWVQDHPGKKLLVFCHHREVIEQLDEALLGLSVKYYGGMSSIAKEVALRAFKQDANIPILIAQRTSAGEGIDGLQDVCHHILNAEIDWSLGATNQGNGRLRRIRQTLPVFVRNMVAKDTLDEIKVEVLMKKQRVFDTLFPNATPLATPIQKEEIPMIEDLIKDLTSAVVSLTVAINNASSEINDAADANVEEAVEDEGVAETENRPKRSRQSPTFLRRYPQSYFPLLPALADALQLPLTLAHQSNKLLVLRRSSWHQSLLFFPPPLHLKALQSPLVVSEKAKNYLGELYQ
jgi:SNF2 family DNA or RNA helicase